MFLETPSCRIDCDGRVACLELREATLADLSRAIDAIRGNPFLEILLLRGGENAFASPPEVATDGRRILRDLETLPVVTLAVLSGPTRGRWLETALACDYRLAIATPDATIGFDDRPRWGSMARLRRLIDRDDFGFFTPRDALAHGLVDAACCERRAKIEVKTWIDRLERRPFKRRFSWWANRRARGADERERAAYLADPSSPVRRVARQDLPFDAIELRRCPQAAAFALEFLLRGGAVVTDTPATLEVRLEEAHAIGRITPLERSQARDRIRENGPAPFVLEAESDEPFAIVRASLAPHARSIRMGFPVLPECRRVEITDGTASDRIGDCLRAVGYGPLVVPDAPRLALRPALAAYWDEALLLAAEGYAFDRIDAASAAVARHAPLRTLDALGAVAAATLAPRLRPFADAGLHEMFYHADRPDEVNALAAAMLGAGPRAAIEEDEWDEAEDEAARDWIANRLRFRIKNLEPAIADVGGFQVQNVARRSMVTDRRAA